MTFSVFQTSRERGSPVLTMEFTYGPAGALSVRYTSNEKDQVINGDLFVALAMEHDSINARASEGANEFSITVPSDTEIANLFKNYPPPNPVSVVIRHGHRGDPDEQYNVVWAGRVLSSSFRENGTCVLNCEHTGSALRRTTVRRRYQYTCPFLLYGPQCKADKESASVETTVVAISDNDITVSAGFDNTNSLEKYIGGEMNWETTEGTQRRTIIQTPEAWTLKLAQNPVGLLVGDTVNVVLGCNHLTEDCNGLHNNGPNFGGMRWIPTTNPINRNNY